MLSVMPEVSQKHEPEYYVLPQSKFLDMLNKSLTAENNNEEEEIVYRKNSSAVECIHTFDKTTGVKLKTVNYDYFNSSKIKSVDEYDPKTGQKIRTTSFSFYKSVTEYNPKTGKKLKTINYSLRDESKISSIHEYHEIYDKINRISIFRPDGKTVSMVKEINPVTEQVEQCINYRRNSNVINSVSKYEFKQDKTVKTTCYYTDHTKTIREFMSEPVSPEEKEKTAKLIDNLFKKSLNFTNLPL